MSNKILLISDFLFFFLHPGGGLLAGSGQSLQVSGYPSTFILGVLGSLALTV